MKLISILFSRAPLTILLVLCQFCGGGALVGQATPPAVEPVPFTQAVPTAEPGQPDLSTQAATQEWLYMPTIANGSGTPVTPGGGDWPQLGHDPQRTNATPEQIDPPYCYAWKWYGASFASRAQPVVAAGRLFIGGMDGVVYARNATTGEGLWTFATGGPIRHSVGVGSSVVVASSHDGYTYGLNASNGKQIWRTSTGASATAPLIDADNGRVFVASTNGWLTGLSLTSGNPLWSYNSGSAILTSPSLSEDGGTVFIGNEAIQAIAVDANSGAPRWSTSLQGQSLTDRYPVVNGNSVYYRSQPLYHFHDLLMEGDDVMDNAGSRSADWTQDWNKVKNQILSFLNNEPSKQTAFALNVSNGASLGTLPVLYTYGNNDIPAVPVVQNGKIYLPYRARHGIQNDGGAIHVTTRYDAELGSLNPTSLDITGLRATTALSGQPQFRMTSDEPAVLTMGGNILYVDNWERLGGINVQSGALVTVSNVSNTWPECYGGDCGPGGPNPFFPMSGSGAAYPFPSPRITEGDARGGAVIANGMIYWRVIEGGIGALAHGSGNCGTGRVYSDAAQADPVDEEIQGNAVEARALQDYVTLDLSAPDPTPSADLVDRLNGEVQAMLNLANGQHLIPYFVERGFSVPSMWPYKAQGNDSNSHPTLAYGVHGNAFWYDPGELLYTLAMAYPYLAPDLQAQTRAYIQQEWGRYPPLDGYSWEGNPADWATQGNQRELYDVPYRNQLNAYPTPAVNYATLYSLWLWCRNTGDWTYATQHWAEIKALFNERKSNDNILYYADIAGAIGYARLAAVIEPGQVQAGTIAAVSAMTAGLNFSTFRDRADSVYVNHEFNQTGWSAPVFYGLVPEVGKYLAEQSFSGAAPSGYLRSLEAFNSQGVGLKWWYLTRVGLHAEEGETSFILPTAAWSHFLGHAYILGESQATLRGYLDRPWTPGDVYSIQKIVAAIQAP